MDCTKALELISALLDGELDPSVEESLQKHLRGCSRCRTEFELEKLTKRTLQAGVRRTSVPSDLSALISAQLVREAHATRPHMDFRRLIAHPVSKTFIAAAAVLGAFFFFLERIPAQSSIHTHTVPNDGNIIHQTYSGFDGMLSGVASPQFASDDPNAVRQFFTTKLGFDVNVPPLKRCRLMGGSWSKYNDEPVANIVYKLDNDMVYLYEARLNSVMDGRSLHLPMEARRQLQSNHWYVENHVPNCTLIVWKRDTSTVCCAVAEMKKSRLVSCLAP